VTDKPNWLPNLVGGVSIWKLAQDLNQDRLMGGRLLVPETEGSESLPARVTWDVHALVPLKEARARFPEDVAKATQDFVACLDRVAKEFADPKSGYHRFKDALTFPSLEGDAEHYFFDPAAKTLKAINWGASPREIAGSHKLVFGYEDWGALRKAAAQAALGTAAGGAATTTGAAAEAKPDETKDDEKKDEEKKQAAALLLWGRPWWHWLLGLLVAIALLLLILWLLRGCDAKDHGADAEAGPDAPPDVGAILVEPDGAVMVVTADGGLEPFDGSADALPAAADAGADARGDTGTDGDTDASGGTEDGTGGGSGGGSGGGGSGGGGSGGGGSGGGGSGGGGSGGGSGGGEKLLPHRTHFHPDAVKWRVTQGANLLHEGSQPTGNGNTYDLTLKRGSSFQSVHVQWQDKSGVWHDF
jgi:hypothetical protein